ncbi:MAG: cupin domain-containing protein [Firmicutes bacterium]|nr:cupin domain-containing protein [Bacillota bacterium]
MAASAVTKEGTHFTAANFGPFEALDQQNKYAKVFIKDALKLTGMEVSLNKMAPGSASPYLHKHTNNEELYLFLKGQGQMQVDGEVIEVMEGTAVRVAPEGARALRNTGSQPLYYLCVQAQQDGLKTWTGSDGVHLDTPLSWPT